MKRALLTCGIIVLCLPMLFAAWLLLATNWPRMDATTMKLPMSFRSLIADMVVQHDSPSAGARVARLDAGAFERKRERDRTEPTNDISEAGISSAYPEPAIDETHRVDAERFAATAQALESQRKYCEAVDAYSNANQETGNYDSAYQYAEDMGRTGYLCGHMDDARHGLEIAIHKEQRYLNSGVLQATGAYKTHYDQIHDRELLIVVYDKLKQPELAAKTCKLAHPEWSSCTCTADPKGIAHCTQ